MARDRPMTAYARLQLEQAVPKMTETRTYRYRIKDRSARKTLVRHAYAVNQVWNWCCAYQEDIHARWRAGAKPRPWPSRFDLQKLCKGVGAELGIHQQTVQAICRQFAQARGQNGCPGFRRGSVAV